MRILVGVLDMGLGHATRSLPLLRRWVTEGHELLLCSGGRALALLQQELPAVPTIAIPSYRLRYARGNHTTLFLALQTPRFLQDIRRERRHCAELVQRFRPDRIFSDHRYGMYHPEVPSMLLMHQITFALPRGLEFLRRRVGVAHRLLLRGFHQVLVPDEPGLEGGLLSGQLSEIPPEDDRFQYVGILSSLPEPSDCAGETIDLLVSISGPEPQRTQFERQVLPQCRSYPGKVVVVLGKPEERLVHREGTLTVYSHVTRQQMANLVNRARCVVCRSGYSTIMELVECGKKALLVPTPGQTEQEYLARHLAAQGWFHAVPQACLSLERDVVEALTRPGLHLPGATERTLSRIATFF